MIKHPLESFLTELTYRLNLNYDSCRLEYCSTQKCLHGTSAWRTARRLCHQLEYMKNRQHIAHIKN